MDRLTTRRPDGRIETTAISYSHFHMDYVPSARINDYFDMRLAAYEDTGLTPEEIIAIKEFCSSDNKTHENLLQENAQLRAQLEQAQAENATLREVIDNIGGALDANQKSWFKMEAANAELRAALEAWVDFAAFYIDKKDWEGKEILRDSYLLCATATRKALASTGSEVLEELRRLRETEKVLYMIASALDAFNLQDLGLCPEWCACYLENPCGFQMELCARRKLFGFEAAEKWASGDEENEIPEKVGGTDATL